MNTSSFFVVIAKRPSGQDTSMVKVRFMGTNMSAGGVVFLPLRNQFYHHNDRLKPICCLFML